jgi:hypothetical protein
VKNALDGVLFNSKRWLSEGLPPPDQTQERFVAVAADLKASMDLIGKRKAEMDADEADAAADPYGAILIYDDPNRDPSLIFEKVCSLTEDEDKRYRDAYERLRRMVDSELLEHISDESDRFCDQLIAVLTDLRDNRISLFDADAWDEHRRKVRSALISFTAALQIHREQTIRAEPDPVVRTLILRRLMPFSGKESSCLLHIHRSFAGVRSSWYGSAANRSPR